VRNVFNKISLRVEHGCVEHQSTEEAVNYIFEAASYTYSSKENLANIGVMLDQDKNIGPILLLPGLYSLLIYSPARLLI
jgi:hypothetical protein